MGERQKNGRGSITHDESLYLDLVRAIAAVLVVIDHAPALFDMPHAPRLGHQAVVVFFVLSGYVITHTVDARETTARRFMAARLARLWSVLIPALALTITCDLVGQTWGTDARAYANVPHDLPVIRIGAAAAFLSESWVSIQPLSDGVIWSLCSEFWYYALFAAWTFVRPGWPRRIAIACAVIPAGHKALLLLPIWLMGVALRRAGTIPARMLTGPAIMLGVAGAAAAALLTHLYDPAIAVTVATVPAWVFMQLAQARVFWLDWALGLAVTAHLVPMRVLAPRLHLERFARPIRWAAGVSFAAYLVHLPLLHLLSAFLLPGAGWTAVATTLVIIAIIGRPMEASKAWWRRLVDDRIASAQYLATLVKGAIEQPSLDQIDLATELGETSVGTTVTCPFDAGPERDAWRQGREARQRRDTR